MSLTHLNIMFVEDNPTTRFATTMWLKSHCHDVRAVPCKMEAIHAMEAGFIPDLWIIDLMLPGCSGENIVKWIQRTYPRAKILITTAAADRDCPRGLTVLHKPYDQSEESLGAAMRTAMGLPMLERSVT